MRKLFFLIAVLLGGTASAADVLIYGPSLAPANCGETKSKSLSGAGQGHGTKGLCEILKGGPLINEETVAEGDHNVTVVDAATWSGMSTSEFASYDAIVIGDAGCDFSNGEDLDPVNANKGVWSPAVRGNITLNTFDVFWHYYAISPPQQDDALDLVSNGIAYAASGDETGLYYSNGCREFSGSGPSKGGDDVFALEFLDLLGEYHLLDNSSDNIVITDPGHPTTQGMSNAGLSGYESSTHAQFLVMDSLDVTVVGNDDFDGGLDKGNGPLLPVVVAGMAEPNSAVIPTLGPAGLGVLILTLLSAGVLGLRRRRR